jgi:hypothetical protein
LSPANHAIVITTINPPTGAVERFAELPGHRLVVVGDKKTPIGWRCDGATFLAVDGPESAVFSLSAALPFNHYCRKMIGYLHAMALGAEAIVDTDDDNLPKPGWSFPTWDGAFDEVRGDAGFVNVYRYFTAQRIWPRGLPLRLINDAGKLPGVSPAQGARVGVWQGLADEDPDVDAIYRLTSDAPCRFDDRPPLVLGSGTITPFNSQNTMFRKELFALLYLPTSVTFRFTDILRSLVAQPILWLHGYRLGFTHATVVQHRNPHDYFSDFLSEVPMYQQVEKVVEVVRGATSSTATIGTNLREAYEALRRAGIVRDAEMRTLDGWSEDLRALGL